jgi:hypothetical protein
MPSVMRRAMDDESFDMVDMSLPVIQPLPPVVHVLSAFSDSDYERLFKFVLRSILHRTWYSRQPAETELLLARVRGIFVNRTRLLTDKWLKEHETLVANSALAEGPLGYGFEYTHGNLEKYDEYRRTSNFFNPEDKHKFDDANMETVRLRVHDTNQQLSKDVHLFNRGQAIFKYIHSGQAMASGAPVNVDVGAAANEFVPGCFGNELYVELEHVLWRADLADDTNKQYGNSSKLGNKLQLTVQFVIGDRVEAETTVRRLAVETCNDPTVKYHDGNTVHVAPFGTARFWTYAEKGVVAFTVGHNYITAEQAKVIIYIRRPKKFGCFDFEEIASVEIPLSALYREIMPLDHEARFERDDTSFHFLQQTFTDKATGMGVTATLHMKCFDREHWVAPRILNEQVDELLNQSQQRSRHMSEMCKDVFNFAHHSALLHLFGMVGEVGDLEFEILDGYRDFYLLDSELFFVAACIAQAQCNSVRNVDDLRDALQAVRNIVTRRDAGCKTRTTQDYIEASTKQIIDRYMEVIKSPESHTNPGQALAAVMVARKILETLGMKPEDISNEIRQSICEELGRKRDNIIGGFSGVDKLSQRASATYMLYISELQTLATSLRFVKEAFEAAHQREEEKKKRRAATLSPTHSSADGAQAANADAESAAQRESQEWKMLLYTLAVHRISCQFDVLVPFIRKFVQEATRQLVQSKNTADPLGETFSILCSLQQRTIDCYETTKNIPYVKAQIEDLLACFANFLSMWLDRCAPRIKFCLRETVLHAPLEPVSERYITCQAPSDAVQLINEVIEFFWSTAACADPTRLREHLAEVNACLVPFVNLFCNLVDDFVVDFSTRVREIDFKLRGHVSNPRAAQQQLVDPFVCLDQKFIGLASLVQFSELLPEIREDLESRLDDLLRQEEELLRAEAQTRGGQQSDSAAAALIPTCKALLKGALERSQEAVQAFAVNVVAYNAITKHLHEDLSRLIHERRSAVDDVQIHLKDFFRHFNICIASPQIRPFAKTFIDAIVSIFCSELSYVPPSQSHEVPGLFLMVLADIKRYLEETCNAEKELLQYVKQHMQLCNVVAEQQRLSTSDLSNLAEASQSDPHNVKGVWASNMLHLRSQHGDKIAKQAVDSLRLPFVRVPPKLS